MAKPREITVQVAKLPVDVMMALNLFTEQAVGEQYGLINSNDFKEASRRIAEEKSLVTQSYCDAFQELKRLLGVYSQHGCADLMKDVPNVLQELQELAWKGEITEGTIMPTDQWAAEDKLAAFEYVGRVFRTYCQKVEAKDKYMAQPFQVAKTNDGRVFLIGKVLIEKRVRKLEISFIPQVLESDKGTKNISTGFMIKIDGIELPPEKWLEVLPDAMKATELWDYRSCAWALFDGGLILFDYDKSGLNKRAEVYLGILAEVMKSRMDLTIEIRGYADKAGSDEHNLELGGKRAQSVKKFLKDKGISADRLITISEGESKPVEGSADGQENAYNRNVRLAADSLCYGPKTGIKTNCVESWGCINETFPSDPVYK